MMIWVSKSKPSELSLERDRLERVDRVGAVAGVPLGELGAERRAFSNAVRIRLPTYL